MDIIYFGHSSFLLKGKSASVITDPFDSDMVGMKFPKVAADIVTISHDHADHNNADAVADTKKVVPGPGEYEVSGVSILGFKSFHDNKKGEERGKNTIFVIEIDEMRIAHLGDLGHTLSDKLIENLGDIDILLLPVGGHFTIGSSEAVSVLQAIEPNIVIPMHYKTSEHKKETFDALSSVDDFLAACDLPVEKLPKLSIKKENLLDESKAVILEKRDK